MLALATCFETGGAGVEACAHDAFQCHVFAAELGQIRSRGIMGEYYERGLVIKRNAKKARDCYRAAARLGDARAQYNLARVQFHGLLGQKQNQRSARLLWERAAFKGHRGSQAALGYCHEKGVGDLKADADIAKRHYVAAANQGCARSAFNLGRLYETRLLCDDNDEHRIKCSRFWYDRAVELGCERARGRPDGVIRDGVPQTVLEEADSGDAADHESS